MCFGDAPDALLPNNPPPEPAPKSMPSLPANSIQRERVTTVLETALAEHCLVLLTAPPGRGKTIVAQQLLAAWHGRALYLRLKPGWRETPGYLWDEAADRLEQQGLDGAGQLKLIGFPDDDARLYHCLAFFRQALAAAPCLLVLDDFHNANLPPLNRFLEHLVSEEIPGFNLLLLSRIRPELPLASLQLQGYAAVLDPGLLDFTQAEARQLFAAAGEEDQGAADAALEFSHGWAAALRLCLQSSVSGNTPAAAGSLDDLLAETFQLMYSPEDRHLLLQLAVMDSFTPAQAAFLSGSRDAPHRLRALYEQNAFIQYSPVSQTYAIHALLRSRLLQALETKSLPETQDLDPSMLYRRAAECALEAGNLRKAMHLLHLAGREEDLLRLLRIFEEPGEGFFMLPAHEAVLEIMESIPWSVRLQAPVGYIGFVHRYAVRVSRNKAKGLLEAAEERFFAPDALPAALLERVRGESALVRAVLSFNDIEAIFRCYAQADELLQGPSQVVNKNMFWTYNCPHSAFLYLKKAGGYAALEELAAENLPHFQRVSGGANAGAPTLLAAERRLETGKPLAAEELLETARYTALEGEQHSALVAVNFCLARLRLAEGRSEEVYGLLEPLRQSVEQRAHPLLLHNLEACQGYIAAVRGHVERIPSWLLQQDPLVVRNQQAHAFSLIVRGKAIMTLKNWPRLLAFAEGIEPQILALGSLFGRLHLALFKAIATANLQQRNSAASERYLGEALELARTDGIITSLAEYGSLLLPLLQRFDKLHPERRDLVSLLRLTKHYARLHAGPASGLTLRETALMRLVRQGANNKEIGEKLGISQGGVANSLSRIYLKLGVGSRIEAINRWTGESGTEG